MPRKRSPQTPPARIVVRIPDVDKRTLLEAAPAYGTLQRVGAALLSTFAGLLRQMPASRRRGFIHELTKRDAAKVVEEALKD